MKPQTFFSAILALVLVLTSTGTVFAGKPLASDAVSTAFTYQGHLRQSGELYNGTCDMQFSLYNALSAGDQVGSTLTQNGVAVVDGLFTVSLDFGSGVFIDGLRWLQIAVSCPSGSGMYITLIPRQALTSSPYAVYAGGSPWNGLTGIPVDFADGVDDVGVDTTYTAGAGLVLTDTQFSFGLTNLVIVDAGGKGHYTSLAEAVAAAPEGTTILVMPGVYSGYVPIAQDNIHIIGSGAGEFDPISGQLVCRISKITRLVSEIMRLESQR